MFSSTVLNGPSKLGCCTIKNVSYASHSYRLKNPGTLQERYSDREQTYGLLTKCEVKMAGYWPSSFFCVFMDRDEVEVHELAKKERGQYPVILT